MTAAYHIPAAMSAGKLLCFGYGYTARALVAALSPHGWRINGTHRHAQVGTLVFDGSQPLPASALADVTHVLLSIPPQDGEDRVLALHHQALQQLASLRWVGYLSTTGVYGDRQGAWVDENTPPQPATARTRARVSAEQAWLDSGLPVQVFRLAGIYGRGRNALEDALAGRSRIIDKPGQVFSRIHVEDIVQTLLHGMAQPEAGRVFNVCDDAPCPAGDVVRYACGLTGITPPKPVSWPNDDLSEMAKQFYSECKRVRNDRIKQRLSVVLRYPTYREGLSALWQERNANSAQEGL